MPYSIHEPAPHHPPAMGYGRGGAGNRTRPLPPTTLTASTLSSPQTHSLHSSYKPTQHSTTTNYSTGRGGIGNMHTASEDRRIFSFDEELAKQGKETAAPVYHIGRGGQGNAVKERRESDASGSSKGSSVSSTEAKRGSLEWVRGLARSSKSS